MVTTSANFLKMNGNKEPTKTSTIILWIVIVLIILWVYGKIFPHAGELPDSRW